MDHDAEERLRDLVERWPERKRLIGYADPWHVHAGASIDVMVSAETADFEAELVAIDGPRALRPLASPANGRHRGVRQPWKLGSCVVVEDGPLLAGDVALQLWVFPTLRSDVRQAILVQGDLVVAIEPGGALGVSTCTADGEPVAVAHGPLALHRWHFVAVNIARSDGTIELWARERSPSAGPLASTRRAGLGTLRAPRDRTLLLGAAPIGAGRAAGWHFNGKLDAPQLFDGLLGERAIADLLAGTTPCDAPPLAGAWRLGPLAADGPEIADRSGHGAHGRTVNHPGSAVTGWNWTGAELDWRRAPEQYGALHFHEDDLDDARWAPSVTVPIDPAAPSGVYGLRLSAGGKQDVVPFFVVAAPERPTSDVALLLPTFSYLAYANERDSWTSNERFGGEETLMRIAPEDRFVLDHDLLSLYESHRDGSGTMFSSRRRPIANLRPDYAMPVAGVRHQLSADLELIQWLGARDVAYDLLTDECVHEDGAARLSPYRVVITGTHPEYWSEAIQDALAAHVQSGGRLMYLGGNGAYWVTSVDVRAPHVIEVRRGHAGTRSWNSAPGELHHATTGEHGGLWRHRGRAPQRLLGVGSSGQGYGRGRPYTATAAAREPRYARLFDGIDLDQPIGPAGVGFAAAASLEFDRYDAELGAPGSAVVLATASGFGDDYEQMIEEVYFAPERPTADVVLATWPNGGAVFSVGSIGWCGTFAEGDGDDSAARLTWNVLRAFRDDAPLP